MSTAVLPHATRVGIPGKYSYRTSQIVPASAAKPSIDTTWRARGLQLENCGLSAMNTPMSSSQPRVGNR